MPKPLAIAAPPALLPLRMITACPGAVQGTFLSLYGSSFVVVAQASSSLRALVHAWHACCSLQVERSMAKPAIAIKTEEVCLASFFPFFSWSFFLTVEYVLWMALASLFFALGSTCLIAAS